MTLHNIADDLTVEQKFAKIMLVLREIRPYYSAVYEVMQKIQRPGLGTVGVTTNTFIYDPEFIDKTPFDELIFIFLHEVAHIALMHVARREMRDPTLWNVACDLYVNAVVGNEFNVEGPGKTNKVRTYTIKFPKDALYCSSIDTEDDYVESIYHSLEQQASENGYNTAKLSELLGGKTFRFSFTGSKNNEENQSRGKYGKTVIPLEDGYGTFEIELDPSKATNDLIDEGTDQNIKNQESHKIVSDATIRVEMSSASVSDAPGGLQVLSKTLLKSELDWKKLLRKYLVHATSSDSSFNSPDKRMYYQKSIYPGRIQDEANQVKGVKVCIDTSGSVSDDDIAYFCGQVFALTKQFKIEAELIYWDTSVQSTGTFTGYKEFDRIDCTGRGGTTPEVVFNYLSSKKCKIKPIITLMFTDGYFFEQWWTPSMKKKYKDCIWILTREHNNKFVPPFGKKALAKFK